MERHIHSSPEEKGYVKEDNAEHVPHTMNLTRELFLNVQKGLKLKQIPTTFLDYE